MRLQLITDLVKHQLEGKMELKKDEGAEFVVKFKELCSEQRA